MSAAFIATSDHTVPATSIALSALPALPTTTLDQSLPVHVHNPDCFQATSSFPSSSPAVTPHTHIYTYTHTDMHRLAPTMTQPSVLSSVCTVRLLFLSALCALSLTHRALFIRLSSGVFLCSGEWIAAVYHSRPAPPSAPRSCSLPAPLPLSNSPPLPTAPAPRFYPMASNNGESGTSADDMHSSDYPQLTLTAKEAALFTKVLNAVSALQLQCTVRVAGGWVRDKLLGLQSDDIDFALDTLTGAQFASSVSSYLLSSGQGRPSSVGTIRSNPEQSKHLETATFVLDGISIDANRFRDEIYHAGSRIPEVKQSTALEDAQRRDFTINALFYNIHTQCVEDLIGGMADIQARRIRTPTSAAVTFRDDPLRVLRAARFAARFGYSVDVEVSEAAASSAVHSDLRLKVTRERVGIELRKMFGKGRTATRAMTLLSEWGLRQSVLDVGEEKREQAAGLAVLQDGIQLWPIEQRDEPENAAVTAECLRCMVAAHRQLFNTDWADTVHDVVHSGEENLVGLKDDEASSVLLMAYLVPYFGWQLHIKRRPHTLHFYLIREALKLPAKESELCDQIFTGAAVLTSLAHCHASMQQVAASEPTLPAKQLTLLLQSGKLLRGLGPSHRLALLLAPILESSLYPGRLPAVSAFLSHLRSSTALFSHTVWSMRPLLDGDEVQRLLGLRPGRHISALQDRLIDWQIERLEAVQSGQLGKTDVTDFLQHCKEALLRDGSITQTNLLS